MSLTYHVGDERPAWIETVTVNGTADNMATGYTFSVKVATALDATAVLTKTTGITGAANGVITIAWTAGELDLDPGTYVAVLTATRTSDGAAWTYVESLRILPIPS